FHFQGYPSNKEIRELLGEAKTPDPVDVFSELPRKTRDGQNDQATEVQQRAEKLRSMVRALALATRASASFPVAFEASFIPIRDTDGYQDMAEYANWAELSKQSLSRFT